MNWSRSKYRIALVACSMYRVFHFIMKNWSHRYRTALQLTMPTNIWRIGSRDPPMRAHHSLHRSISEGISQVQTSVHECIFSHCRFPRKWFPWRNPIKTESFEMKISRGIDTFGLILGRILAIVCKWRWNSSSCRDRSIITLLAMVKTLAHCGKQWRMNRFKCMAVRYVSSPNHLR